VGAAQDPGRVVAPGEHAGFLELGYRQGDRRALRAHEAAQRLVGERQRDDQTFRTDSAPAVCELREHRHEAVLHAPQLADGAVDARTLELVLEPVANGVADGRPPPAARRPGAVEDNDA
jgi:hypothetical protein